MKRQTKNNVLLYTVKRQEEVIQHLRATINTLETQEKKRDELWSKFEDARIREWNIAIRALNKK